LKPAKCCRDHSTRVAQRGHCFPFVSSFFNPCFGERTMNATKEQVQQEALDRAVSGQTLSNYPAIIRGFVDMGIPADDIRPRENVFTYHAWRALGRQVRRGEHGVKVVTFVPTWDKSTEPHNDEDGSLPARDSRKQRGTRPWTATVFHVSQTDPI
jgi:hypothetical protein